MKKTDVFDTSETRGGGHAAEWAKLDPRLQAVYAALQAVLQNAVESWNPGKFLPTSGWRSREINTLVGGVGNSLHLVAMARDFIPSDGGFCDPPLLPGEVFSILKEDGWWHVSLRVRCGGR